MNHQQEKTMNEPKQVDPVRGIVDGLFERFSPHEIISIMKECENVIIDRFALESEERQSRATQATKLLEEARQAFGFSPSPQTMSKY